MFSTTYKHFHTYTNLSLNVYKSLLSSFTNQRHISTYEFISFLADTRFENNLYSLVTNRQVRRPGFVKTEQFRLVFYFDCSFYCLILWKNTLVIKIILLMQWIILLFVYYFTLLWYITWRPLPQNVSAVLGFGVWQKP